MSGRNVVITSLGAVSPLGLTAVEMWEGLKAGRCGLGPIRSFDASKFTCSIAGEAPEFKINKHVPKAFRKIAKLMCNDIKISVVAAEEAFNTSGLVTKATDPENVTIDPTRSAINLGAGFISCDLVEIAPAVGVSMNDGKFDIQKWGKDGLENVTPLWLLKYLPNMLACHIGIIHDLQGPSNSITAGEASSLLAVSEAAQIIERGDSDIAVSGGAEAKVNPMAIARYCLMERATAKGNDSPQTACRPFDAEASGSVFSDGAGIVILEEEETAKKRGATLYARIAGLGSSMSHNTDYRHIEADGEAIRIAVQTALDDAGITADKLDLIIPHGTGIACDDLAEAKGIQAALGDTVKNIPVWPTKSMLGNAAAGSGALDLVAACFAMNEGTIPAAKNCDTKAAGCELKINTETIQKHIAYCLLVGYSYGGQVAAMVLENPNGS